MILYFINYNLIIKEINNVRFISGHFFNLVFYVMIWCVKIVRGWNQTFFPINSTMFIFAIFFFVSHAEFISGATACNEVCSIFCVAVAYYRDIKHTGCLKVKKRFLIKQNIDKFYLKSCCVYIVLQKISLDKITDFVLLIFSN